jgi:hypothetical protein
MIQPQMRFKPRTDLERIYDAVNQNNFGRASFNVVEKQLKDLELNVSKKNPIFLDEESTPDFQEIGSNSPRMKKKTSISIKNMTLTECEPPKKTRLEKSKTKKTNINSEAKTIMSDLYFKTHFKGAAVIANQPKCK